MRPDGQFVRLEYFTIGTVEFYAIAIVGYVAARNHERPHVPRKAIGCHRWRRYETAIVHMSALMNNSGCTGGYDPGRGWAKITSNRNMLSGVKQSLGFQMLQKAYGVGEAYAVAHRAHEAAGATCTESDARHGHQVRDRNTRHKNSLCPLGNVIADAENLRPCGRLSALYRFRHAANLLRFAATQYHDFLS